MRNLLKKTDEIPASIYQEMITELEHLQSKMRDVRNDSDMSEIRLPLLTLTIKDSIWLTSLIYEDIERTAYTSKITTKPASNCIEHEIILYAIVSSGTLIANNLLNNLLNRSSNYLIEQVIERLKGRLRHTPKKYTLHKKIVGEKTGKKESKAKKAFKRNAEKKKKRKPTNYSTWD